MTKKFSQEEIDNFLTKFYIDAQMLPEARELLENNSHVSSHWRSLALAYSDIDDLENSLYCFKRAYDAGDRKAIPWYLELLKQYSPDDPNISKIEAEQERLRAAGDPDIIFSLGNLQLMADNFPATYEMWRPFVNKDIWMFDRNLYGRLLGDYESVQEVAEEQFGHLDSFSEVLAETIDVYLKYMDTEPDALVDLIAVFTQFEDDIGAAEISAQEIVDLAETQFRKGVLQHMAFGAAFAQSREDVSAEQIYQAIRELGLTQLATEIGIFEDNAATGIPVSNMSSQNFSSQKIANSPEIELIFERGLAAQKSGDTLAELQAWIDGAKLGNPDCFYNIGILLGNQMGITCNFFGCQGGDDQIWGVLAKGIQMDDMRAMTSKVNYINEFLGQPILQPRREQYQAANLNTEPGFNKGSNENFEKLKDYLNYKDLHFVLLAENILALPYSDNGRALITFMELIKDDDKEMLMIYAPIMTSKLDETGKIIDRDNPISDFEAKLLRIIVRNFQVIFPNMGLEMGEIFNSLPTSQVPTVFFNSMKSQELWSIAGQYIEDMIIEPIPTKHEFSQFYFGYAVDASLQSDFYDTAIRGAFGAIIGVITTVNQMYREDNDLFNMLFEHDPITANQFEMLTLSMSEQLQAGVITAVLEKALKDMQDRNDYTQIKDLEKQGIKLAKRLAGYVEYNKKNIDFITETLLSYAKEYQEDVELRNALNNVGWYHRQQLGNMDKAFECFEAAVSLGSANALSNLSWYLMLNGRFAEAVEICDKYYYRIMTTRNIDEDFTQAPNFRSNVALCRWALGASKDELNSIWKDEYFQAGHAESAFYPILMDYLDGQVESAKSQLQNLSRTVKDELMGTFKEGAENDGWFGDISNKALELLGKDSKRKGIFG